MALKVERIEEIYLTLLLWVTQKDPAIKEAKHVIFSGNATFHFATSTLKQDLAQPSTCV
jgi:hypothetical protein